MESGRWESRRLSGAGFPSSSYLQDLVDLVLFQAGQNSFLLPPQYGILFLPVRKGGGVVDYSKLQEKRRRYLAGCDRIPELAAERFERAFEISYTHNSTAIEGNTLTLVETKLVLEDGISVGGKDLREIYEQVNHQAAFRYVKECIAHRKPLSEAVVKNIHQMLMEHILPGGIYRNVNVYISGAQHTPPEPGEMYHQIKAFYLDLEQKGAALDPIGLAAWTHAEFVRIHPFQDGNGRTSRLIMNYQLLSAGFPAVDIAKEHRLEYFQALEAYAVDGDLTPFTQMIAALVDRRLDQYLEMIGQVQELPRQDGRS